MKAILFVLSVMVGAGIVSAGRQKRSTWQLGGLIRHATGRCPWDYDGYGCWCGEGAGEGGSGRPVDAIDRCCRRHANCYKRIPIGCSDPKANEYTYQLLGDVSITCDDSSNDACQQATCQCDRMAATCFGKHTYHVDYKNYDQDNCKWKKTV